MQGLYGNEQGIVHALNPHVHAGGHAGKHSFCLIQRDDSGVGAVGSSLVNFGHSTRQNIVADGTDRNVCLLSHRQGENVPLVYADGYGHLGVRGQGNQFHGFLAAGLRLIQVRHRVHAAGDGRGQAAPVLDFQQFQQVFFGFPAGLQQGVIVGAGAGVRQGEQGGGSGNGLVFLHIDSADRSGVAGDSQGGVDVKTAFPHFAAVLGHHRDGIPIQGAVIGNQNRGGAADYGFHHAILLGAVGQLHHHGGPLRQCVGFHVHGHIAIQGQHRQGPVFHHHVGDPVLFLGIEELHPAGNAGGDAAADPVSLCSGDVVVQVIQGVLKGRHGAAQARHIHGSQQVPFCHRVPELHQDFRDFHPCRGADHFRIHIFQHSRSGDQGADGAPLDLGAEDFSVGKGELLPHPSAQGGDTQNQGDHQNAGDDGSGADALVPPLFLGLAQGLKQGVVPLRLGDGGIFLIVLVHRNSFRLCEVYQGTSEWLM